MKATQAYDILRSELIKEISKEEKEILLDIIKKHPYYAYNYAYYVKGRWKEAEEYIKKDPQYAYYYAKDVIKDRWIEAEEIIKKEPQYAYHYARDVIKGRWKEAEEYIKYDPQHAYYYAIDVIKGRWIEAEEYIKKDREYASKYAINVIKDTKFWDSRAALLSLRESIKSEPAKSVEKTSSKDEIISALERLCS